MILQLVDTLIEIGWVLLVVFIIIAMTVISLQIGIRAVKGDNTSFGNVFLTGLIAIFITALITIVIQVVLSGFGFIGSLVSLLLNMLVIQRRHNTTFFGALGAIVIYAIMLVILAVLFFLVTPGLVTIISNILNFDLTQLIP